MDSKSRTGTLDEDVEEVYLLQKSGLRFSQGIRSVTMLAEMMEERFKSEDKTAHALQNYCCDWTKTLADISSSGNGGEWITAITEKMYIPRTEIVEDFEHGSMYAVITKILMEPIEDARIYNLVKNEGLGNDGPVTFLRSWKAKMERSHIPKDTIKLYSTAWEKHISTKKEIGKAMEYYHRRKYKLENGLRQLKANPHVHSSHAEARLRKSMYRYHFKCEGAREEYKNLLKMEEAGREQCIADIRTAQRKFERFEKNRMMNTSVGIEKFLDSAGKLDTERAHHQGVLQDIHDLLKNMKVEPGARDLTARNIHQRDFLVFAEFDENAPNQKDKKKTWIQKLNLRIRRRNQTGVNPEVIVNRERNKQCEVPEVVMSYESDPNLVKEITISDDDSDAIKVITMSNQVVNDNDEEKSETEIFEIDEKGREIKMNPKPHSKTSDVRAHEKHEKLSNATNTKIKATPKTEYVGLPNAIESDSERDVWGIPEMKRTVDPDLDRDTSTIPPKLTEKATKLMKKTQKESSESIKPIKESRKVKDKEQTEVNVEKRKVKDKVQEKVNVESSDSDTDTHVPDAAEVRTLANVNVIAIRDYTAQNKDELTLKAGQKIKQKIPANSDGMAYGWTRKGKLRRKNYGYYPANLVELEPQKEKSGILGLFSKKRGILKFAS